MNLQGSCYVEKITDLFLAGLQFPNCMLVKMEAGYLLVDNLMRRSVVRPGGKPPPSYEQCVEVISSTEFMVIGVASCGAASIVSLVGSK